MRRSAVLLLTCILALAGGLTLLRMSEQLATPVAGLTDGNAAVVRRFYDAVNTALRSGDGGEVERLVAAGFVDHSPAPGLPPTRAGLVRYLLALHAVFPTTQLELVDVVARADAVMARVRIDGARQGSFLGLAIPGELAAWGPLDAFRVAAGRIVAHWGGRDLPALLEPRSSTVVEVPAAAPFVSLARFTYAPRARSAEHVPPGPLLLAVEEGTLVVDLDRPRRLPAESPSDPTGPSEATDALGVTLRPGEWQVIPAGIGVALRNPGPDPAVFLGVAIIPASVAAWADAPVDAASSLPPAWWPVSSASGSRFASLAAGAATGLRAGSAEVALGRATLAPGASFPADEADAPVLLAVEAGTLGLALGEATSPPGASPGGEARFRTGQESLVPARTGAVLRNAGADPLVLLILTVLPAEPDRSP